jgi:diguanylate cyclase
LVELSHGSFAAPPDESWQAVGSAGEFRQFVTDWAAREGMSENTMGAIEKPSAWGKSPVKRKTNSSAPSQKLKLATAIRILQQAGLPDPTKLSHDLNKQLQTLIDSLCNLSVHDGLTGLMNVTFFHAVMSGEIDRSARTNRTCSLILIDLDHFKKINDNYGHHAGDVALKALAQRLKTSLRSMDTAARIGGEEFAVILPECSPEDAINVASRLHRMLNPITIEVAGNKLKVTASMGLVWTDGRAGISSKALLAEADRELYRAKQEGRGRLCYPPISSTQISAKERAALTGGQFDEESDAR